MVSLSEKEMNEQMNPYVNLWIAVLHAGIEDALKGWNDSINWLESPDFNEICAYVGIDPDFAMEMYKKKWIPVKTRDRAEPKWTIPKEVIKRNCATCNKELTLNSKSVNRTTCSRECSKINNAKYKTAWRQAKKEKQNGCN